MDLADYSETPSTSRHRVQSVLALIGVDARRVPADLRQGRCELARRSRHAWYKGPSSGHARPFPQPGASRAPPAFYGSGHLPLRRAPDRCRPNRDGNLQSATPWSSRRTTSERVASIEGWNARRRESGAGDRWHHARRRYLRRTGHIACQRDTPIEQRLQATFLARHGSPLYGRTQQDEPSGAANSTRRGQRLSASSTLRRSSERAQHIESNDVAEVTISHARALVLDNHAGNSLIGRFVLVVGHHDRRRRHPLRRVYTDRPQSRRSEEHLLEKQRVRAETRAAQRPARRVLWLTGLSGSGKSTIAVELEQRLVDMGYPSTCSTATTSATGSTRTSASRRRTAPRTSGASARWRSSSPTPA